MSDAFRLLADARNGTWIAHAVRVDTGERFGIEVTADSERGATARLADWLEWQEAHAGALDALRRAERAYHRSVADRAFAAAGDTGARADDRLESLRAVDQARVRLDEVRARRPM